MRSFAASAIRQQAKLGRKLSAEEIAAIRDPVVEEYKRTSSAYYSPRYGIFRM